MIRILLFGSGSPLSTKALAALARFGMVGVVVPRGRPARGLRGAVRRLARWRGSRPLRRLARRFRVPVLSYAPGGEEDLDARIRALEPDLVCVASFPHLLKRSLLAIPRRGALGLHPSLLPRHRGPDPLFWTYFHGDEVAGITVFWLDEGEDTGDILAQESLPLARGRPGIDLYHELAERGAALLVRAVEAIDAGTAQRMAQDPAGATREPAPRPVACHIDPGTCGAEWLWHVLRGVGERWSLLTDRDGGLLLHGPVRGFVLQVPLQPPGTVERAAGGWRVHCRDGFVDLARAGLGARARWVATRLRHRGGLTMGAGLEPPSSPRIRRGESLRKP